MNAFLSTNKLKHGMLCYVKEVADNAHMFIDRTGAWERETDMITIKSFSYRAPPPDGMDGFVFDCRMLVNPGWLRSLACNAYIDQLEFY